MKNIITLCLALITFHSNISLGQVSLVKTSEAIRTLEIPFTQPEQITQAFSVSGKILRREKDGRGLFLEVYATSSDSVNNYINDRKFNHPEWVKRLLVSFGNIYREIILNELNGHRDQIPQAWKEVFVAVKDKKQRLSSELMSAMQAHISRDMVFALVEAQTDFDSPGVKADYLKISEALKNETPDIWKVIKSYGKMRQLLPTKWEEKILVAWTINLRKRAWMRAHKIASAKTEQEANELKKEVELNAAHRIDEINVFGKFIK